jgi:hypothetical protein
MFESIVSQIARIVRTTVRVIGAATRRTPWLAPAAVLALLLVW